MGDEIVWLFSIAAGGAGLPRGTAAAGAAGADFQWVRGRVFFDAVASTRRQGDDGVVGAAE